MCDSSEAWTYAQLNAFANRTANRLQRLKLPPESLVGICLPRSLYTIGALIGVLKAGAAYVPLDLTYPEERLRFMLEDTRTNCVITDARSVQKLPVLNDLQRYLIRADELDGESASFSSDTGHRSSLAYVIYTSGSTGMPKGVMIEHRGIVRLVCDPDYMTVGREDVFIQLAPLSFDASTFEVWAPLLNGAKLVIPPPAAASLADIAAALERYRITSLWLTSGLFNAIVDEYPTALRNIRQMLAGGDVLSPAHVRRALEAIESGSVINGYGPTENTTFTCCYQVSFEDTARTSIPIGRPICGTQIYILDGKMRPVSGQEVGEIYIGGAGLARGYWNRPELTAEKFVNNPFSSDGSSRLYRSGDLGHCNERGDIEFDGRIDRQVKIRGFRIELPEIEAIINSIPGIGASVVVVKDEHSDEKRLACYFARQSNAGPEASELEFLVRTKLPAYMVPAEFVELDRIPLNPNGKLDRHAIVEHVKERATNECRVLYGRSHHSHHAGLSSLSYGEAADNGVVEIQEQLASILAALFRISGVGADDDFFQLGGNSLLAARLFAKIEKRFGKKLPLTTILDARTVRRLAAVIADDHRKPSWSPLVPLKTTGSLPPLFLVHAIGGNVVGYRELAAIFPDDQPLYALQAEGLDSERQASTSITEMAANYVASVRRIQPKGPYNLGGYSAGGVIAFAMAYQLQETGSEVASLILIDSSIEVPAQKLRSSSGWTGSSRWWRILRWNLTYLGQIGAREFLRTKVRNFTMNGRVRSRQFCERLPDTIRLFDGPRLNVEEACIQALRQYTPGRFRGTATLLRTHHAEFYCPDPTLGWSKVIDGSVNVNWIEGDHDNILTGARAELLATEVCAHLVRSARPL